MSRPAESPRRDGKRSDPAAANQSAESPRRDEKRSDPAAAANQPAGLEALRQRWRGHVPRILDLRDRYAVLCPFLQTENGLALLLEVRAAALRRQPGEVCFPGGKLEAGEDAVACAIRETGEELAVPAADIQVFGPGDVLVSAAGFTLEPVVGCLPRDALARIVPSAAEVAGVFTVPVEFFQNTPPDVYVCTLSNAGPPDFPYDALGISPDYRWASGHVDVPVWRWRGRVIWGMTARIIRSLLPLTPPPAADNR